MLSLKNLINKKSQEQTKDKIPVAEVGRDYLKRTDGRYCAILSVTPVNMALLSKEDTARILDTLRMALNAAPERMQIFISSERLNLDEYIQYLQGFVKTATDAGQLERLTSMITEIKNRTIRSQKVLKFYIVVESKFTKEEAAHQDLADITHSMSDILKSVSMNVVRLQKHEIMGLLYTKLCPDSSLYEPATKDMELHELYPSIIDTKTSPRYYMVDESYFKSYTIIRYPTKKEEASWLSPIFQLPIDLDINITLTKTDKEKMLKHLNSSVTAIRHKKEKTKRDALKQIELEQEEEDALDNLKQLANDNENQFAMALVITIRETSLEALNNSDKTFRTQLSGLQMRSRPLIGYAKEPLWYSLPICYKGILEDRIRYDMPSHVIASMQPFNSSTLAGKTGIIMGENVKSHDLIIIDKAMRKQNPHAVYLAKTRAGKSYALFADILRHLDQNEVCIDIDPERERVNIPGEHIYFSLSRDYCINPFHIRSTVIETDKHIPDAQHKLGDYLRIKIDRLMSFFQRIHPDMTQLEAATLETAIRELYQECGLDFNSEILPETFPTISELDEKLAKMDQESTEAIRRAMKPFHGDGTYARMFDGQTNWGFTRKETFIKADGSEEIREVPNLYTRLDVHDLEMKAGARINLQALVMDLLLSDIWEFVKMDRSMIVNLYVDETWLMADPKNPQTLQFLHDMSKRGGKYGLHLTVATQNVADFLRTTDGDSIPYGEMIVSNAGIKVLLHMYEKDISRICEFVTLSEPEKNILRQTDKPGQGIVIVGTHHAQIQTFMTPEELKLYDPEEYNRLYA